MTAEGELNGRKHGFAFYPKEKEVIKRFISAYWITLSWYKNIKWKEANGEQKRIDEVYTEEAAEAFDTLGVTKDSTVKIEVGEEPATIRVNQWNEDQSVQKIELTNDKLPLPAAAGYYIYEVIAEWDQGYITYVFDLNVS